MTDNNYSIWSRSFYDRTSAITSGPRYSLRNTDQFIPTRDMGAVISANSSFIGRIAETSPIDALDVWLGAVSGRTWFDGNPTAARNAGAKDQPNWDTKRQYKALGISKENAEALGNYMYGATGYENGMNSLVALGFNEGLADKLVRWTLRFSGGVVQTIEDLRKHRFMKVDHNWYGEELKDVAIVEAGMEYGRFLRFSRIAEKVGVELNPQTFGLGFRNDSPTYLLDKDLSRDLGVAELQEKVNATIDRLNKDRENAANDRLKRERILIERLRTERGENSKIQLKLP